MKEKINVLIISPSLKNKGGITTVVQRYLNSNKNLNNVKFFHLSTQRDGIFLVKIFYFLYGLFFVNIFMYIFHIDIVHFHVSEKGSIFRLKFIYKIIFNKNKKIIVHHHGAEFVDRVRNLPTKKFSNIVSLLKSVSCNIVLSEFSKKTFESQLGLTNVEVVYNGVDTKNNIYLADGEKKYILFMGRIGQRKGTFDLVEAINKGNFKTNFKFLFCGDGENSTLKRLIDDYKLSDKCIVLNWISGKEKENILKKTYLNILPSYNEGLPMTILETMSLGIPNISTNVAGIPEIIDSSSGIIVCPGDIDALIKAINFCLNSAQYMKIMSNNSFEKIKKDFSVSKQLDTTYHIYRKLIGGA